jgi:biopolymer transport protein ExbD
MKFRKRIRKMPEISTASLPDIIFMLLFFFMVVTVLKKNPAKLQYTIPEVAQNEKLDKEEDYAYLYIGKNKNNDYQVQLNNRIISYNKIEEELVSFINSSGKDKSEYEVLLKADKGVPMKYVRNIKLGLRKAGIRKMYYSSTETNK